MLSKNKPKLLLLFLFISLQTLAAATNIIRLEKALQSGDFATVQELVPTPFDPTTTIIDGKNLQKIAQELRDKNDAKSSYDQIAYYCGIEHKNLSTPLLVFMRTNVKKLGVACLVALGLYYVAKQKNNNNNDPEQPDAVNKPSKPQEPIKKPNPPIEQPLLGATVLLDRDINFNNPKRRPRNKVVTIVTPSEEEATKNKPQAKVQSALFDAEMKKPQSKLDGDGDWCSNHISASQYLYNDFLVDNIENSLIPLYFYEKTDAFYQFTNFAPYPITIDDKVWPTSEHYFQGQKFADKPIIMEQIRTAGTCRDAFDIGKKNKMSQAIQATWDKNGSTQAMEKALAAKFTQHQELHDLLLATGDAVLIENTKSQTNQFPDAKWGAGNDGNGQNLLGLALMKLRHELRNQ